MPSRVSRITLPAMVWPAEFQMWTPLPRRFWLAGAAHSSPSPGFAPGLPPADRRRLRRVREAEDRVALDARAVGVAHVDAVQALDDAVVADDHARRR